MKLIQTPAFAVLSLLLATSAAADTAAAGGANQPAEEPASIDFLSTGRIALDGKELSPTIIWNECDGNLSGNYVGLPCSRKRGMADDYAAFLNANIFSCVNAGMVNAAGGARVAPAQKIHLLHDGTLADERHKGQSLHAAGRAIDILSVQVTSVMGVSTFDFKVTSKQPEGRDRKFYEGFRQCWHNLHVARKCPARDDGFPIGTMGWEDKRHINHHLHTSMPFCPDSGGHWRTFFNF